MRPDTDLTTPAARLVASVFPNSPEAAEIRAANAPCFWAFNPLHGCYDRADDPGKFAGVHTGRTVDGERTFTYDSYVEASPLLSDAEIDDLPHVPIVQVAINERFPR